MAGSVPHLVTIWRCLRHALVAGCGTPMAGSVPHLATIWRGLRHPLVAGCGTPIRSMH
jgi:hypothetical protein